MLCWITNFKHIHSSYIVLCLPYIVPAKNKLQVLAILCLLKYVVHLSGYHTLHINNECRYSLGSHSFTFSYLFILLIYLPSYMYQVPRALLLMPPHGNATRDLWKCSFRGQQSSYSGSQWIKVPLSVQMKYSTVCHTGAAVIIQGTHQCALQILPLVFCWMK